jgi:Glycosyltransferase family 87
MIAAGWSRNRVPVAVSVVIAAALRIYFAIVAVHFTPHDTGVYFREVGVLVLHGQDPLMHMPYRSWNFLELMPYVYAVVVKSGISWYYGVKIAPIAADVVLVWIVSRLAGGQGRTRALQYAVNPVSLLIASLHGQIEPVALALALGGVLVLRTGRPVLAGVLLGAAVAAKTWPVLILIAVLPLHRRADVARILAGAAVVPVLCLASGVLFLGTKVPRALILVLSYTSNVRNWTWSGVWLALHHVSNGGYDARIGAIGAALAIGFVSLTLYLLRRHPPEERALGALCAALAGAAGFGAQYLMWVLPLTIALADGWRYAYVLAATAWDGIAYLMRSLPGPQLAATRLLSFVVAATLVGLIVEQVRRDPSQLEPEPPGRSGWTDLLLRDEPHAIRGALRRQR